MCSAVFGRKKREMFLKASELAGTFSVSAVISLDFKKHD